MAMQFTIVGTEDGANITVFIPGQSPLVAHSSHPNYDRIVAGVMAQDESVAELFDVSVTVASKFERLTERVSVASGRLYFDSVEVDNSLATQVIRFLNEGIEDYKPLVSFFDNVMTNDNKHSREQLYDWLEARDFTITPEGMIVGYKGVSALPENVFESISSGRAIVNGEVQTGRIKQKVGDVVEMPRNEVQFDPGVGCSTGLHVGTWDYASGFGRGAVLEVHVNPRDVVSVPTDSDHQKMRVSRYVVVAQIDVPYTAPVWDEYEDDEFDDEYDDGWRDDSWGDGEDDELIVAQPEPQDDLNVAIDASGSMSPAQLDRAFEEAERIVSGDGVIVAFHSYDALEVSSRDEIKPYGGSGLKALIKWLEEEQLDMYSTVILTDGHIEELALPGGKLPENFEVRVLGKEFPVAVAQDWSIEGVLSKPPYTEATKSPMQSIATSYPGARVHPNFGEQETEDGKAIISVGDKFGDKDQRRLGNIFTVESLDTDGGIATGKWSPTGLTRSIAFDRLLSRKYFKV